MSTVHCLGYAGLPGSDTAVIRLSMRGKLHGDRIVRFEKPLMWLWWRSLICINFVDEWRGAQLIQISAAEKSNLKFILFNTFTLTHAWVNSWCFHRKLTIQVRFWPVRQNTTLFGCSFRWPCTFHGSLSWPTKASSNLLHQLSPHFLAKN